MLNLQQYRIKRPEPANVCQFHLDKNFKDEALRLVLVCIYLTVHKPHKKITTNNLIIQLSILSNLFTLSVALNVLILILIFRQVFIKGTAVF